ncbi:MAG: ABC transporter substrate-binding protein [Verrucomicrobia bacterium]|nr:ABC transporter substrate-binding protein [Verrucomicrobiota bacterium]MDE3098455.1 ABC transporter substrate-binding protein [Verrucomicrobiota bacterium]
MMRLKQIAVLAAAICALAGCGKKSAAGKSAASHPLPEPPVVVQCTPGIPGGRLIIAELGDPKTFNPIEADEWSSLEIVRFLFWNLLNFDVPSQKIEPGLADWWTNSPDGKTWEFRLRKNLRWSDGAPLAADDVVFTWNDVIYNPKIPNPWRDAFIIKGKKFKVTKVDDLTIKVVTPEVYAPFLVQFGAIPIIPEHILSKSVANDTFASAYGINSNPEQVVGSGPFVLEEYKPGQYTLVARNPYFLEVDREGQRLPYFNDVIFEVVPQMDALSLRFLSGGSDLDDIIYPYEYDKFKSESAGGKFTVFDPGIGLENSYFWFNENTNSNPKTGEPYVDPVKLKWFRNVKFRQACSYAIDRQAIIRAVFSGRAIPEYGFETPGNKKWFNPNINTYPYDPAKALALLKEIGIEKRNGQDFLTDASGHRVEFVLYTNTENPAREKIAVLIQGDFQKLGMKVIFQPVEFNTLITKINATYNYDCILMGMAPGGLADPSVSMSVLQSSGYDHDWFPRQQEPSTPWEARIDKLMNDQMTTLDFARRKKDYDDVQQILSEKEPMIFTVTPTYYAAARSNIGNVRPTALTPDQVSWNAEELYFKK